MNDREVINDTGSHNKTFKFVPGLRPSTGNRNAAHSYAA